MTRELTTLTNFDHGTLLKTTANPKSPVQGPAHTYYVPHEAQKRAGMSHVEQQESIEDYRDDDGTVDWDDIQATVSPQDIVERAETRFLNRKDGDIGHERRPWSTRPNSSRTNEEIPNGVVKFCDPDASDDTPAAGDPVERGYCWGVLQDQLLSQDHVTQLSYQDDVAKSHTTQARIPMCVVKEGTGAMIAYLWAHDHSPNLIGYYLERDPDAVQDYVDELIEQNT